MSEQRPERPNRKAPRPGTPGANGGGGLKFGRGVFGWLLFIGLAVMLFMLLNQQGQNYKEVTLNVLLDQLDRGKVEELTIDGTEVTGKFTEPYAGVPGTPTDKFKTNVSSGGAVPEILYAKIIE